MLARSLLLAALYLPLAARADDAKAPCRTIADYLSDYAKSHSPADTEQGELLDGALDLWDERAPDAAAPVSTIAPSSADSIADAVQSISNARPSEADLSFFDDNGLITDGALTYVRDLRPYAPLVLLSQIEGTMHCNTTAVLRVEGTKLILPSETMEGGCWGDGLTALRVGKSAYPALWSVKDEPLTLEYSLSLLNLDNPMRAKAILCGVTVKYETTNTVSDWDVADTADPDLIQRLQDLLDPLMTRKGDVAPSLQGLAPKPEGGSLYDQFIKAQPIDRLKILQDMNAAAHGTDWIPLPETGSGSLGQTSFYPIEVDHHRLVFAFGPLLGLMGIPNTDNSFEIFEWDGTKLNDVATGDLKKKIGRPTVSVD